MTFAKYCISVAPGESRRQSQVSRGTLHIVYCILQADQRVARCMTPQQTTTVHVGLHFLQVVRCKQFVLSRSHRDNKLGFFTLRLLCLHVVYFAKSCRVRGNNQGSSLLNYYTSVGITSLTCNTQGQVRTRSEDRPLAVANEFCGNNVNTRRY